MSKYYVDSRERIATYIDKFNNHYADNTEIVKFVMHNPEHKSPRYVVTEQLGISLNLTGIALKAFITLICYLNGSCKSKYMLAKKTLSYYNLETSPQSVAQFVNNLYDNFIIMDDSKTNGIKINPKYYVDKSVDNAKFLVIELSPEITSATLEVGI